MREVMAGFMEPFSNLKQLGSHWNQISSVFLSFLDFELFTNVCSEKYLLKELYMPDMSSSIA
jgi:hypothetical protein